MEAPIYDVRKILGLLRQGGRHGDMAGQHVAQQGVQPLDRDRLIDEQRASQEYQVNRPRLDRCHRSERV